jgi:nucleolar protein 9
LKFAPKFDPKNPSQNDNYDLLENTLLLSLSTLGNTRDDWPTAEERRNALFLEKLLDYDTSFLLAVWTSFLAMPKERFLQMCFHGVFSHVVEHALAVIPASIGESKEVNILRKRLLNVFQGSIVSLACNAYGSHIVDKLWSFTVLMKMYKERFATELKGESHKVKESTYGRLVWKNWSMELFIRKKYDWSQLIKVQDEEYHNEHAEGEERAKRPIELKMEQLAKKNEKSSLASTNNDERNKRQRIR